MKPRSKNLIERIALFRHTLISRLLPEAGQLWMSDVMHGPAVIDTGKRRRKTYLVAFIDDATRVITHA